MSDLYSAETPVVQLNQVTNSQKQPLNPVVDPGEGPGGAGPSPLFLAQVEVQRASEEKWTAQLRRQNFPQTRTSEPVCRLDIGHLQRFKTLSILCLIM